MVGRLVRHLAASPGGGEEDTDEDGHGGEDHEDGHMRIVPRPAEYVASRAGPAAGKAASRVSPGLRGAPRG